MPAASSVSVSETENEQTIEENPKDRESLTNQRRKSDLAAKKGPKRRA